MNSASSAYCDTAHLFRRAGFGATPDEIKSAAQQGLRSTTNDLLNYNAEIDPIDDSTVIAKLQNAMPDDMRNLLISQFPVKLVQCWWVYRMLATKNPLQEKMTLFWHNHFTSKDGGEQGRLMLAQNQTLRRNAMGNFRTLTLDISKDPEMLRYLNGNQNYKAHPNENYARELMELFTCGRVGPNGKPNYTEDDIKASARAFSGWNSRLDEFVYNPNQHDDTTKTFLGHTGNLNGDDVVDILVGLSSTASYITRKLFRFFAYDDPELNIQKHLVDIYFDSGYEIKPIVEAILTSPAFYSQKSRLGQIKSPVDYAIGSIKMLGLAPSFAPSVENLVGDIPDPVPMATPTDQFTKPGIAYVKRLHSQFSSPVGRLLFLTNQLRNMGQELFAPPTVKGWDGGTAWINTDTLQARGRFASALAGLADLPLPTASSAADLVDQTLYNLGPLQVNANVRKTLISYASSERVPERAARGVLALALGTVEYQLG